MKKSEKGSLNRRLLLIYTGYFVVLALGFMHSIMPSLSSAMRIGIAQGESMAELNARGIEHDWYLVTVKPDISSCKWSELQSSQEGVLLSNSMYEGFVSITAMHDHSLPELRERLANLSNLSFMLELVTIFAWVAILVLVGLIINSLRKSIRDNQIIDSRNILKMRLIGIMIIIDQVAEAVIIVVGHRMLSIASGGELIMQGFPIEYGQIVLGLLIIFTAEVFALGARLSEEQKLTI